MTVRVIVDQQRCFGYGRCVNIAPEVFTLGEDGRSIARDASDIDRDQLESYAKRKGVPVEDVERWLASNLSYDPAAMATRC